MERGRFPPTRTTTATAPRPAPGAIPFSGTTRSPGRGTAITPPKGVTFASTKSGSGPFHGGGRGGGNPFHGGGRGGGNPSHGGGDNKQKGGGRPLSNQELQKLKKEIEAERIQKLQERLKDFQKLRENQPQIKKVDFTQDISLYKTYTETRVLPRFEEFLNEFPDLKEYLDTQKKDAIFEAKRQIFLTKCNENTYNKYKKLNDRLDEYKYALEIITLKNDISKSEIFGSHLNILIFSEYMKELPGHEYIENIDGLKNKINELKKRLEYLFELPFKPIYNDEKSRDLLYIKDMAMSNIDFIVYFSEDNCDFHMVEYEAFRYQLYIKDNRKLQMLYQAYIENDTNYCNSFPMNSSYNNFIYYTSCYINKKKSEYNSLTSTTTKININYQFKSIQYQMDICTNDSIQKYKNIIDNIYNFYNKKIGINDITNLVEQYVQDCISNIKKNLKDYSNVTIPMDTQYICDKVFSKNMFQSKENILQLFEKILDVALKGGTAKIIPNKNKVILPNTVDSTFLKDPRNENDLKSFFDNILKDYDIEIDDGTKEYYDVFISDKTYKFRDINDIKIIDVQKVLNANVGTGSLFSKYGHLLSRLLPTRSTVMNDNIKIFISFMNVFLKKRIIEDMFDKYKTDYTELKDYYDQMNNSILTNCGDLRKIQESREESYKEVKNRRQKVRLYYSYVYPLILKDYETQLSDYMLLNDIIKINSLDDLKYIMELKCLTDSDFTENLKIILKEPIFKVKFSGNNYMSYDLLTKNKDKLFELFKTSEKLKLPIDQKFKNFHDELDILSQNIFDRTKREYLTFFDKDGKLMLKDKIINRTLNDGIYYKQLVFNSDTTYQMSPFLVCEEIKNMNKLALTNNKVYFTIVRNHLFEYKPMYKIMGGQNLFLIKDLTKIEMDSLEIDANSYVDSTIKLIGSGNFDDERLK